MTALPPQALLDPALRMATDYHQQQENEANLFAIELLMPREFMVAELKKLPPLDVCDDKRFGERIDMLANKFKVPRALMTQRYFQIRELMKT